MRRNLHNLIKKCVLEVLEENLSEAFDPSSQGPNPPSENPYPVINAKMRKLEEDDSDDIEGKEIAKRLKKLIDKK